MDEEEVIKLVKSALAEAIAERPAQLDEAVVLHSVDGSHIELRSSQESLKDLLATAHDSLNQIKQPNGDKKLPGVMAWG